VRSSARKTRIDRLADKTASPPVTAGRVANPVIALPENAAALGTGANADRAVKAGLPVDRACV
jgi:hypothetical protein